MIRGITIYFFILVLSLTSVYAQTDNQFTIIGRINSDKGKHIDDVEVIVYALNQNKKSSKIRLEQISSTKSNKEGKYQFQLPVDNNYQVAYFKSGWKSVDKPLIIHATDAKENQKISIQSNLIKGDGLLTLNGTIVNNDKELLRLYIHNIQHKTTLFLPDISNNFHTLLESTGEYEIKVISNKNYVLYDEKVTIEQKSTNIDILLTNYRKRLPKFPFDINTGELSTEGKSELNTLAVELKSDKNLKVTIECHTDSRGDDEFNLKKSKEQAESIKNYLILQGVSPYRINANGFGENLLLNECKNNVKCSNLKHLENRRVEYLFSISNSN
ncbi:OmpA family protein [Flammeovirga kamogawensis]|uniref:OmpA family protein n=1 Tax=Flammeovirga kamogawensis TaxID=373891 RepID=A0ABX8GTQ3_9BACT|nr:OmpA family protein [Flammeovirga kamogawensis]MBB6462479.1 outer membrane protein OmpA-like peptidoglycan-associated protein [Flammeovirga kamogawensis]QWG06783.1 OmpA family protein [Flammeovirga kamogawensis]TRX68606.1 OmpA family protein [Flammeovirga kamogawensis]